MREFSINNGVYKVAPGYAVSAKYVKQLTVHFSETIW